MLHFRTWYKDCNVRSHFTLYKDTIQRRSGSIPTGDAYVTIFMLVVPSSFTVERLKTGPLSCRCGSCYRGAETCTRHIVKRYRVPGNDNTCTDHVLVTDSSSVRQKATAHGSWCKYIFIPRALHVRFCRYQQIIASFVESFVTCKNWCCELLLSTRRWSHKTLAHYSAPHSSLLGLVVLACISS